MALFNTATIIAAVDTGPRELRSDADKVFFTAVVQDVAKGLFSTSGNTFPELHWDTSRIAYTWGAGGGATAADLFLQRYAATGLELRNAGNTAFLDFRIGVLGLEDGVTAPSTVSGVAQLYVDTADGDLKVKFGDGTVKTITVDT